MKRPILSGGPADWPHLDCPKCGENGYLHHGSVNVYARDREDAETGAHVFADGSVFGANSSAPMGDNPSPRRGGLTVDFSCEVCGGQFVFAIIQHKGKTYAGWQ